VSAFAFGRVIEGVLSRIKIIHKKRNGKERPFNPAIDMPALDKSRDKVLAVLRDAESDMTPTQVAHEAEMSLSTARRPTGRFYEETRLLCAPGEARPFGETSAAPISLSL
jgi:hypothetical protein